jgi:hypothetical protein
MDIFLNKTKRNDDPPAGNVRIKRRGTIILRAYSFQEIKEYECCGEFRSHFCKPKSKDGEMDDGRLTTDDGGRNITYSKCAAKTKRFEYSPGSEKMG